MPLHSKIVFFVFIMSFQLAVFNLQSQSMRYLALGDSYTIGEAVPLHKNWPNQLVKQLQKDGYEVEKPDIIAVTGWRTDELMQAIAKEESNLKKPYHLVSLLIGVNNQYQNKDINQYKVEFEALLLTAISKSKLGNKGVFIVSIPDYGVSDFAKEKNLTQASKEVEEYNAIAFDIAKKHEVAFYNITPVSQITEAKKNMYADDRLHPSAKQYQLWLDVFYREVKAKIEDIYLTE